MGAISGMVGARIKRREDPRLITGNASYTDDFKFVNMSYAHFLRSDYAHARIKSIDTSAAKKHPGVLAVLTGEDLKGKAGEMVAVPFGANCIIPPHSAITSDKVRYVGEVVAVVIADDRATARDASELISVEYEELPAVVDIEEAAKGLPALVHDGIPNNIGATLEFGDAAKTKEAFANAEVIVEQRFNNQRLAPSPMEGRGCVAVWQKGEDALTLYTSTQIPHYTRTFLALTLSIPEHQVRVVAPEVGGGFGAKLNYYPEELVCAYAARKLGRPVKWSETRSESLASMIHGRGQIDYVRIAANKDGTILGIDITAYQDIGAYYQVLTACISALTGLMATGAYDMPAAYFKVYNVITNKVSTDAYRGAGRPEATYFIERIVTLLANELGMDQAEIRRKNFIPKEKFPFATPVGLTYDSGDYDIALDKALEMFDYANMQKMAADARANGRYVGIGMSSYSEVCGMGPSKGMFTSGGWESATLRFEKTGKATVFSGASPHGQGQETSFAQMVATEFGLDYNDVIVKHGDTGNTSYGLGTYGSRGTAVGGAALAMAIETVKEKARKIAASMLEASEEDVVFDTGKYTVKGAAGGKSVTIQEVVFRAYVNPFDGIEPGLESTRFFEPTNFTFPFGTHICAVEIDADTGEVKFLKYVAVDDVGNQINPLLVEGQVHGGLAQGIAQALYEEVVYDSDGQLVTGTLMDYTVPNATELPHFELGSTCTPSPVNPMGVKGVGEAGTIASTPCVVNALMDALINTGIKDIDMPLRPEKLWRAIHGK
ncbi:MAG: xanthine dehydrogenase family protein molybdopterin-binding subunit [Chloroflexi bacterium]|uniref:Xanthine dehydrogenase family protein molybdopterin-binding subunit n=1 Tax=Candidatus Chlorohelix allophototropha TaxID=3003348 RepID=A0A8T7M590_9CHLR|nr:xanthine dehydrogenase family protein molybdopterin-binding subunit [Chloroflexota bacterium]WJW69205.1 xanthine dehydrogenase family protein molybdopterin-binding subunit [Chloroflexota bacterium L227-S17]